MELRAAIICILQNGGMVDVAVDLTAYKYGNQYCVEYWYDKNSIDVLNLTAEQRKIIKDDDELLEFFDTPEEATDFCLKISNNRITSVKSNEDDDYF
jgi:hypothetical protein